MSPKNPKSPVDLHEGYEPGVVGRIGELHGRYYAQVWGSGATFELKVVRELADFVEQYNPQKDLLLTAQVTGVIAGSLAVLGQTPRSAQIRWVIVAPEYRGLGAGKLLLSAALDWCRQHGFSDVFLWTTDHLPESRSLYEKAGFRVVERVRDDRYSVVQDNLKMELHLTAAPLP